MMAFALGSLMWTEYEYYCSTLRGFANAQQGYNEEKKLQQHYLRRVAYITHISMVSKPLTPEKLWPIDGDIEDKESTFERLKRRLEEHRKRSELTN